MKKEKYFLKKLFLSRFFDSDLFYSFSHSPISIIAGIITVIFFLASLFAPWITPRNPFDMASIDVLDSFIPPIWELDGDERFLLGTDDQGRGILSTIIHGSRISLFIGFSSVIFAMILGVFLGLVSGFIGGILDAFIMRVA